MTTKAMQNTEDFGPSRRAAAEIRRKLTAGEPLTAEETASRECSAAILASIDRALAETESGR